jgi:hypothetical protein
MNPKNMSLEEYTEYVTSMVGFMEMWQHCYYALLSNPEHSDKQMKDLQDLSWKHAEELKRAASHYLEDNKLP